MVLEYFSCAGVWNVLHMSNFISLENCSLQRTEKQ